MPRASRTGSAKKAATEKAKTAKKAKKAKKATAKKTSAKKTTAKKATFKKTTAKKATAKKKAASPKTAAKRPPTTTKAARKKAEQVAKKVAVKKSTPNKTAAKAARPAGTTGKVTPRKAVRGHDAKFVAEQRAMLLTERDDYERQALAFREEAEQLAAEMGPGDSQFDEETGGEGDAMSIERERDLAMSAQARSAIDEIDRALAKMEVGTYGVCERCHQPIPKPRLKALPYASLCVQCKSGGLSSRR